MGGLKSVVGYCVHNSTDFSEVLFMDYGEEHFSDVPMYYRVRLSPTMKIEYGYFPYNWNENFFRNKKTPYLGIWSCGNIFGIFVFYGGASKFVPSNLNRLSL